jgi:Family of unknown function (DUF6356)
MMKGLTDISFVKHPRENGMNYFQHMRFALMLARLTLISSIASLVHAFLPFLFETHTSKTIAHLHTIFEERKLNNNSHGNINRKKTGYSRVLTKA